MREAIGGTGVIRPVDADEADRAHARRRSVISPGRLQVYSAQAQYDSVRPGNR